MQSVFTCQFFVQIYNNLALIYNIKMHHRASMNQQHLSKYVHQAELQANLPQLRSAELSKQKQQSMLLDSYRQAMLLLKSKQTAQGSQLLKKILSIISEFSRNQTTTDKTLEQLYHACLISLSQLYYQQGQSRIALQLLYEVASTKNQFNLWMKIANICQKCNLYDQAQFTLKKAFRVAPYIWKERVLQKLLQIYIKNNKSQAVNDLELLMSNPFQIQQIMAEEKQFYKDKKRQTLSLNKYRNTADRNQNNKKSLQKQLKNEQCGSFKQKTALQACKSILSYTRKQLQTLKDLQITLYRDKNQQRWEFVLSLIYVLLKMKSERNFNGKKYLSKYDKEIKQFAQGFNPLFCSIQIILKQSEGGTWDGSVREENMSEKGSLSNRQSCQQKQLQSKISVQKGSNRSNQKIQTTFDIKKMAKDFLSHQSPLNKKKKTKKKEQIILNSDKKYVLPSQTILAKKSTTINYRTNYKTMGAYIRQTNHLSIQQQLAKLEEIFCQPHKANQAYQQKQQIQHEVKCVITNNLYHKVFGDLLADPIKQLQQNAIRQKQKQQRDRQVKQKQDKQKDKQSSKKKAQSYKQAHLRYLQQSFSKFFLESAILQLQNGQEKQQINKYQNIFQFASDVVQYILNQGFGDHHIPSNKSLHASQIQRNAILDNPIIRNLIKKVIAKIIQNSQRYFDNLLSDNSTQGYHAKTALLQLLAQKVDEISFKNFKSKQFKNYQLIKIAHISKIITQKLEPQTFFLIPQITAKQIVEQDTVNFAGMLAKRFKAFIIFYSSLENYSQKDLQKCLQYYSYYAKKVKEATSRNQILLLNEQIFEANKKNEELQSLQHTNQIPFSEKDIRLFVQNRINKVRSILNINDMQKKSVIQEEQKIINIQQILNRCGNEGQSTQRIVSLRQMLANELNPDISAHTYFRCMIQIVSVFFRKLKLQTPIVTANKRYQFDSRMIIPWAQFLQLQNIMQFAPKNIQRLLTKYDQKSQNQSELQKQTVVQTTFLLIKLYLVQPFDSKGPGLLNCYKIILQLVNYQLKHYITSEKIGETAVNLTILLQSLISAKKKSEKEVFQQFNRRMYFTFLSKHIKQIYNTISFNQNEAKRQKILTILQSIYYDKDKPFSPKKFEDAIGYFIYMSKAHAKSFECKQIDLATQVNKVFRNCYKIFADSCRIFYPYCEKFEDFYYNFMEMITSIKLSRTSFFQQQQEYFIEICKGQKVICQCCQYKETDPEYLDALYIIGKYFQTQHNPSLNQQDGRRKAGSKISKEIRQRQFFSKEDQNIGEKTFLELLLLDFKSSSSWENIIRVNCMKAYQYFDQFISPVDSESFQFDKEHHFKDAFSDVKKISAFIKRFLNDKIKGSLQSINILNAIKLAERNYQLKLAECLEQWQVSSFLSQKYHYGLQKVIKKFKTEDVRIKFIQLIQMKFPYTLYGLRIKTGQKQLSNGNQQSFKSEFIVIMKQVLDLQTKYKTVEIQVEYNVKHLQQDLIIQFYILVLEMVQIYMTRIILNDAVVSDVLACICNVIDLVESDQFQNAFSDKYQIKSSAVQPQSAIILKQSQPISVQQLENNNQKQDHQQEKHPQSSPKRLQSNIRFEPQINQSQINEPDLQKQQSRKSIKKSSDNQKQKNKQINTKHTFDTEISTNIIIQFLGKHVQIDKSSAEIQQKSIKIDVFLKNILRVLKRTPQLQTKRYQFRRSVINSMIWSSRTLMFYTGNYHKSNSILRNYYNLKTDDIVFVYHHYEKISTQKNELLAEYYNRSLVYMTKKIEFLVHLIKIFSIQDTQNLIGILKKLLKITIVQSSNSQKQFKVQRCYFFVFLFGLCLLLNSFQQQAKQKKIDQKHQRMLSEWRNRIKKIVIMLSSVDPSQDYQNLRAINKLETFMTQYQEKYKTKMRIKKTKQIESSKQIKTNEEIINQLVKGLKIGQLLSQKLKLKSTKPFKQNEQQFYKKQILPKRNNDKTVADQIFSYHQEKLNKLNIFQRHSILKLQIKQQQNIIRNIKQQKGYLWDEDNQIQIQMFENSEMMYQKVNEDKTTKLQHGKMQIRRI